MRLYVLLFALCAIGARAATIPEAEKKLPVIISEQTENTSSEQELIDQANTIKDVENNLRVKPAEDIPVAVIVENPEASLKISEEDDIVRPEPDLNNPGLPQRQLHETQNPEYHDAEQQSVLKFKQSINEAQVVLRQGFQGVSAGIQHFYESNAQLQNVQQTIKSLRDGFTTQINKLNDTIHQFLNPENPNNDKPVNEESKANFKNIETGLSSLKNDFTRGVNTLAEGVDVVASLRDDAESPDTASTFAPVTTNLFVQYLQLLQNTVLNGFNNLTQAIQNQGLQNQGQGSKPADGAANSNVQSDTPAQSLNPLQVFGNTIAGFINPNNNQQNPNPSGTVSPIASIQNSFSNLFTQNPTTQAQGSTAAPVGLFGSGSGPIAQAIQNQFQGFLNFVQPNRPGAQVPAASTAVPKPEAAAANTTATPAKSVQDVEKQKDDQVSEIHAVEVVKEVEAEIKGHEHGSGDNNERRVDAVETSDIVQIPKEVLSEEPKKEVTENKPEQTDNKTD